MLVFLTVLCQRLKPSFLDIFDTNTLKFVSDLAFTCRVIKERKLNKTSKSEIMYNISKLFNIIYEGRASYELHTYATRKLLKYRVKFHYGMHRTKTLAYICRSNLVILSMY